MFPINLGSDRDFDRALARRARRLNPSPAGSRWATRAVQGLTAVTIVAVILIAWASIAGAGKITPTGDCSNRPAVSWRSEAGPDFTVSLAGPSGTVTGLPADGSAPAEWGATYTATWIRTETGIPWGSATATLPTAPVCEQAPTTPAPELALDLAVAAPPAPPAAITGTETAPAPTPAPTVATTVVTATHGGGELPATGRNTDLLLLAGTLVAAAGIALLIVRRRPVAG